MGSASFGWDQINSGVASTMPPLSRSSAVDLAKILAGDARLYEPNRLPAGTDLSEMDLLGLQSQVRIQSTKIVSTMAHAPMEPL